MAERLKRALFGGRSAAQELSGIDQMAEDPVCGMQVDKKKAAATSEYRGQTYYFCAPGCKKAFDQNPEKYLREAPGMPGSKH